MKFADELHRQEFEKLVNKCHAQMGEKDIRAAVYLLSSPLLSRKRCERFVHACGIRFSELQEKCGAWSSSERGLAKLAASLFNSSWKADVNDVFWNLDAENVDLALEALRIRFQ